MKRPEREIGARASPRFDGKTLRKGAAAYEYD